MSGFAFTKPNQMVSSRPMFLMSASETRGGESQIEFPFVSALAAMEGEVASISLSDVGEYWIHADDEPVPAAEVGVSAEGPCNLQLTLRPGQKLAIHKVE